MRASSGSIFGVALAAMLLALGGCSSTGTPYQPLSAHAPIAGGYTDQQLSEGRFRVTFAGNRLTSRERVERYLLYRAAELTVEQGYDWFVVVDHEMDHRITREIRPDPFYRPSFAIRYGDWRPYWRHYDPRYGWLDWDPYHGDPFWARQVESEEFQATAEIRMGKGAIPEAETQTMDARRVMADIGPEVERPD